MQHRSISGWRRVFLCSAVAVLGFLSALSTASQADESWSQAKEVAQWQATIQANGLHWQAGPTPVNAIAPEQRSGYLGLIPISDEEFRSKATAVLETLPEMDLPSSWDWRALGGTTPAKDQGGCGSCWDFAATGALESIYKITNKTQQLFSEQQVLSCNDAGQGCGGGNSTTAYSLWTGFGAVPQACMPYTGGDSAPCVEGQCTVPARIQGYTYVKYSETSLKTAIMTAPIAVAIYASGGMFSYRSGCYSGPNGPTNHMILLCGWDDNACGTGQGAWLIKNSWGTGWGQSGFGWITYGTCSIGYEAALINYTPPPVTAIGYASHQVLDGGNGALDPGETVPVSITVTNFGAGNATGVSGILRSLTPGVTVPDSTASFPNLASWATGTSIAPHFTVQVGPQVAAGAPIEFQLEMHSNQTMSYVTTFYDWVSPVTVVYQNDFETGIDGWSHAASQGTDDWRWGTLGTLSGQIDPMLAASGTKVIGNDLNETGGNWDGLYPNSNSEYLLSPVIDCSGHTGVQLQFKRWLTCERGYGDVARILVNGTEIWRNDKATNQIDGAWTPAVYDIHTLADNNPSVQIRFELNTDDNFTMGGWNIDDFRLISTDVNPAGVSGPAPAERVSLVSSPNPFQRLTSVALTLPAAGLARVQVFDSAGRLVRTIHDGFLAPGRHQIDWTGTDASGQPVPAGTYFCRAQADGQAANVRLVRMP